MLILSGLRAGYGTGTVVDGADLRAEPGTVHTVTGPNGAGKTTLVAAITGTLPAGGGAVSGGRITWNDRDITGAAPHHAGRAGIALIPQGRRLWPSLTVAEHLRLAAPAPADVAAVTALFPALASLAGRRGDQLSGGEQQLVAAARALCARPALLLADEPLEGLAPAVADRLTRAIADLARRGAAVVITAPDPGPLHAIATYTHTLTHGRLSGGRPTRETPA